MGNSMDNHINEAVGDNDPLSTTSTVFALSESETAASGRCVLTQILGDKYFERLAFKSWDILCGTDRETDEENLGYSGLTNQWRGDPVNPEDMKGSGDKNLPQVKDRGQGRETDDKNHGCNGLTKQKEVDPVYIEDTKGSGDTNLPQPLKDIVQDRDTDEDNLGCRSLMFHKNDDPGNRKDIKGSSGKKMPQPVKDIGQHRETDDENLGGNGFTNPRKVEPFHLEDMKGSDEKNLPQVKYSGQDHEKDDENLRYSGFTNQRRVNPVNPEDMKGSGDKNLPQAKDTFERRAEYKSKEVTENDPIHGCSMNTSKDRQMQIDWLEKIYNAVKKGSTIPVPEDMGDPQTPPCNM